MTAVKAVRKSMDLATRQTEPVAFMHLCDAAGMRRELAADSEDRARGVCNDGMRGVPFEMGCGTEMSFRAANAEHD